MTAISAPIADEPPASDHLAEYDRKHLKTYARLLDVAADHADWCEVASIVLGLDPAREPERARRVHGAHLERASWMTTRGYRDLLADASPR